MKLRISIAMLAAFAAVAVPTMASAQFGGLGHKLLGGGDADGGVSAGDADAFLGNAMLSTKNVMISAALLSAALQNRTDMAALKGRIDGISNMQSFKELGAEKVNLEGDLSAMTARGDLSADLTRSYQAADAHQKQIIATALINLALGVYRNVKLAGQAPDMVKSVGSNPAMLRRIGEFKTASDLIVLQGKSFGTIAPALPKVLSTLKIKAPEQSESTKFQPAAL